MLLYRKCAESIVLLCDFEAHVDTDDKTWKAVIGGQGDSNINRNGRCLPQFCHQRTVHNKHLFSAQGNSQVHPWYRDSVEQRSIIDFCIVSVDLFSSVFIVFLKRGAELFTNHHLVSEF